MTLIHLGPILHPSPRLRLPGRWWPCTWRTAYAPAASHLDGSGSKPRLRRPAVMDDCRPCRPCAIGETYLSGFHNGWLVVVSILHDPRTPRRHRGHSTACARAEQEKWTQRKFSEKVPANCGQCSTAATITGSTIPVESEETTGNMHEESQSLGNLAMGFIVGGSCQLHA